MHPAFSRPLTSAACALAITIALTAYARGKQVSQPLPELKVERRGFAAERTVDGLPNCYDPGARDLTINVKRFEVIKGPQGVLSSGGTNATGGVVKAVSKLPTATRFAEFGIMGGTNCYLSPYSDVNQLLSNDGSVLIRVTGPYQTQHHDIDALNTRNISIKPTLVWTKTSGTALIVQGHYSRCGQQDFSGLPAAGTIDRSMFSMSRDLLPGHPEGPKTETDRTSLTGRLDHEVNTVWSWSTVAGATAQAQSGLHDRLHLLVGGRLAPIRVSDNDLTGTRLFTSGRPELAEINTTRFLPRAGLADDLTKAVTVFAEYAPEPPFDAGTPEKSPASKAFLDTMFVTFVSEAGRTVLAAPARK